MAFYFVLFFNIEREALQYYFYINNLPDYPNG